MANRIRGNVYIIDSQTGVNASLQPGTASWLDNAIVSNVVLWSADTTGAVEFVYASDSQSTAIRLVSPPGPISAVGATADIHFAGDGIRFEELRCKTLTAGTAWIYFS